MHALTVPSQVSSADRLGVTIFFAVLAHLIVILGVTFSPEVRPQRRVETLDIVLVPLRSETAPEQSDYLAQANRDGGGANAERVRPATPAPSPVNASEPDIAAVEPAMTPVESVPVEAADDAAPAPQTESEQGRNPAPVSSDGATAAMVALVTPPAETYPIEAATRESATAEAILIAATQPLARLRQAQGPPGSQSAAEPARVEPVPVEETPGDTGSPQASFPAPAPAAAPARAAEAEADTRMSRRLAMAALSAEIERDLRAYAERPRRKWISASTREHKFAAYMDAWRRKVEQVGNLNYPEEAERRGLASDLLLDVAIRPDGTVEDITLRRSSGERVLDDAAIRIVEIAAPFSEFPESIAEDVDILHIERTWIFHSGGGTTSP